MRTFLGMGVLAITLAAAPGELAAEGIKFHFGIGVNVTFRYEGPHWGCGHGHGCFSHGGHRPQYLVTFPEAYHAEGHQAAPQRDAFPPPPNPERKIPKGERRETEAAQWGYPNLNYSLYNPVSYDVAPGQSMYAPAGYGYPQPYYSPAAAPGYYPAPGMTFDR